MPRKSVGGSTLGVAAHMSWHDFIFSLVPNHAHFMLHVVNSARCVVCERRQMYCRNPRLLSVRDMWPQLEALVWHELDTVATLAARLHRGQRMLPPTFASYRPPLG